ncbi:MAG TPA: proprotein convertase P-domain-containing protein [Thermoanaerobaculia bacterium]|nr:proprotein convertase P-domain-containing protein [Thermoanaerobaculia bacterium]
MILLLAALIAAPDLRLELQRESLTGTHYRYRQSIDGIPVAGGEVNVTVRANGTREEHRHLAVAPAGPRLRAATVGELAWVNQGGVARLTRREVVYRDEVLPVVRYRDAETGAIVLEQPFYLHAKEGAVFDPNPVVKLNAPELRDQNDSALAVPPAAYSIVELQGVRESGPLGGPWVQIAELQAPAVPPVDSSGPLIFDRSESGFEDVNAYFHIDRSQRRLQSLGYAGPRALVPYAIETDTHAAGGTDNSFFVAAVSGSGRGRLFFGEGGTDDAEDSDLVVHEYAHAIHEWISPGTFFAPVGSAARAIGEGFGDYWAMSAKYAAAAASGRDPFCFADWDARCWEDSESERCAYPPGSECLRRVDSTKTMADYIEGSAPGVEHRNGEIWSSALAEIFVALTQRYGIEEGRRVTDTLVIESFFGTPPNPGFATMARQMMGADRFLSGGANLDVICAAMTRRAILDDCVVVPRGEVTLFPGAGSGVVVPDNDRNGVTLRAFVADPRPIERLMVRVDIRHRGRGELQIILTAPDGTTVRLVSNSPDRSPDLVTTFGRDSIPLESLDVFRSRSAAGEWQLQVIDVAPGDVATVISWALVIEFEGEGPAISRPLAAGIRQIVPIAGRTAGVNGTFFTTDLRLFNSGTHATEVLVIFTPSGADGRSDFAAVRVMLPADTTVAFDDVVRTLFGTAGIGQIEIAGALVASTRTSTPGHGGTFGFAAPFVGTEEAIGRSGVTHIAHLRNDARFRSNLGFAEVSGAPARAVVRVAEQVFTYDVPPHGHLQVPLTVEGEVIDAVVAVEGEGRLLAYGAVVDNRSGDPILVPARSESGGVIPAISAPGVAGTHWRTDVAVTPPAVLTYTTPAGSTTRVVDQSLRIEDAVASLFGLPGTSGVLAADAAGIVSARIWTDGRDGTYGLFAPFETPSAAPRRHILHVENSDAFRTNLGLVSDVDSLVRVTIFDGDGAPVTSSHHAVHPWQLVQFPLLEPVVNGRALVELIRGRVYAYGALVDNGTGDAAFLPARP